MVMDSGVFEIGSIFEVNPATFLDGVLNEYGSAEAYNAPFVENAEKGPGRWNPSAPSTGQFSGFLKKRNKFVGNILGQSAFKQPLIPDDANPGAYVPDAHSEALAEKKQIAILCPASIFTGRTRLYVQALYGLPLGKPNVEEPSYSYGLPYSLNITGLTVSPSLKLQSSPVPAGETRGPDVLLTTSCGVWLDPETGEHWLFQITDRLNVYPLKARDKITALRKYLRSTSELSETDKRHLETYIISQSLPDAKQKQTASASVSDVYSMGYGWHWNYSGTEASVVEWATVSWEGDPDLYYTLTNLATYTIRQVPIPEPVGGFGPNDTRVGWEGNLTRSGSVKWATYRYFWVFAEPDFYTGESVKVFNQNHPPIIECAGAPIYVYYIGDRKVLYSADITFTDESNTTTESDGWSTVMDGAAAEQTFGMGGGFRRIDNQPPYFSIRVSSSDYISPEIRGVTTRIQYEVVLSEKAGPNMVNNYLGDPYSPFDVFTWVDGSTYTGGGRVQTRLGMPSQTREDGTISTEIYGTLVFVVPTNDAQAVFIDAKTRETTNRSGTSSLIEYNFFGFTFVNDAIWIPVYGDPVYLTPYYGWDQIGSRILTQTAMGPYNTTNVNDTTESLFVGMDKVTCVFSNLGAFLSNDLDVVSSGASALSSSDLATPIILSPMMGVAPTNTGGNSVSAPVITGWV